MIVWIFPREDAAAAGTAQRGGSELNTTGETCDILSDPLKQSLDHDWALTALEKVTPASPISALVFFMGVCEYKKILCDVYSFNMMHHL